MTVRTLFFQAILTSIIALYGCGGGGGGSTPAGGGGPTLVSIIVTSPSSTIAKGTSTPFTATGLYSNGTSSDVTFLAAWNSSHTAISTVTVTGLAISVDQGTTTISAVYSGKTATASLTVTSAVLVSLSATPPTPSIPKGLTQQFTARGKYSDNSEQNITPTWTSFDPTVATIDPSGLASAVAPGSTTISAEFSGMSSSALLTVTNAVLASLEIAPSNTSVPKGWPQSFTATGTFTDSTTQDLTSSADWGSSNTVVATISAGVASSLNVGSTTISAIHSTKTASTLLTVTPAEPVSLSLWPPSASIANGKTQAFTATAVLTDSSPLDVTNSAAWGSSDDLVSTVSTTGLASSVAPGTTTISAVYSGLTATAPLTISTASLVSISLSPSNASIAKGLTQLFTATGHYSDASNQDVTLSAAWSSANSLVSTISATGLASSVDQGTTTISAVYSGQTATVLLTVTPAAPARVDVMPINPILRLDATQQFAVSRVYTDSSSEDVTNQVTWSTSDPGIATITAGGLTSPVSVGTAAISAEDLASGLTGTTLVLVRAYVTLPDTGQTGNYTTTFGEDSDYTINPPSYVKNGYDTTRDLHTELEWQQQDNGVAIKWTNADAYCQNLILAGQTDWRLPTRRELMTILDLEPLQPKINSTFFTRVTGTVSGKYWSSDPRDISNALDVNFDTGELSHAKTDPDIGDNLYVRCVRGTMLIRSIFSDNGDSTVIDYATGLMWQQDESSTMFWGDALTYCEDKVFGGHSDWRVPNSKELESLIDISMKLPAINKIFFSGAQGTYWSSTVLSHKQTEAYYVNFDDGTSSSFGMSSTPSRVRCVRGGY